MPELFAFAFFVVLGFLFILILIIANRDPSESSLEKNKAAIYNELKWTKSCLESRIEENGKRLKKLEAIFEQLKLCLPKDKK